MLQAETVEHVLSSTTNLAVGVQIAALDTVVRLGLPSEARQLAVQWSLDLIRDHRRTISVTSLRKLATATALIPDVGVRDKLYEIAPTAPPAIRVKLLHALGFAHDANVVGALLPAARGADRIAAHALATFPAAALAGHLDAIEAAAAAANDLDARLWLDVTMAKQDEPARLLRLLDDVDSEHVPRSLFGLERDVEARFERIGALPEPVREKLVQYRGDAHHAFLGRRVASLLADPTKAELDVDSARTEQQARGLATRLYQLSAVRERAHRIGFDELRVLRHLPADELHDVANIAVELSFSPHATTRALATNVIDAVAGPTAAPHVGVTPVREAFPRFEHAIGEGIEGYVEPVVSRALNLGAADDVVKTALQCAARTAEPRVQAGLLSIAGGHHPLSSATMSQFDSLEPSESGGITPSFLTSFTSGSAATGGGSGGDDGGGDDGGGDGGGPGGGSGNDGDRGLVVFPHLAAPAAVAPDSDFVMEVGLRANRDVDVDHDGFGSRLAPGYHELHVRVDPGLLRLADPLNRDVHLVMTEENQYPTTRFTVLVPPIDDLPPDTTDAVVGATYFVDRQPLGTAQRHIALTDAPGSAELVSATTRAGGVDGGGEVDLTIQITRKDQVYEWFAIEAQSGSAAGVTDEADATASASLADEIRTVLDDATRGAITALNARTQLQRKLGRVRRAIPQKVWSSITRAAHEAQEDQRAPRIMLVTSDPNVPWEAAFVGHDVLVKAPEGTAQAPFFGAQAAIGRLDASASSLQSPTSELPARVRVLAPRYDLTSTLPPLNEAKQEADDVSEFFQNAGADVQRLPDAHESVLEFIVGGDYPDVLHVAAHGRFDDAGRALVGLPLLGTSVTGNKYNVVDLVPDNIDAEFEQRMFVFLNVCFAAAGASVLGHAVSLANAFADAGAFGVVAPLWQVDDTLAAQYALDLYELARTVPVAEAVRVLRNRARLGGDANATWLAYRFFGHPDARLTGPSA